MSKAAINLPYFDSILANWEDEMTQGTFAHHVHWGYWENPNLAEGTVEDFAIAAEKLSQKVYQSASIKSGDSILDVGCGFGGTISSINDNFSGVKLTGLNIDDRQIAIAKEKVLARPNNSIEFYQGDANQMPFDDNSFDVVLAVECIFHFPSREKFFQEAIRVLKPGGKIALSDFSTLNFFTAFLSKVLKSYVGKTYGYVNSITRADYQQLAQNYGLKPFEIDDITFNTLPTYPMLQKIPVFSDKDANQSNRILEWATRFGWLRYLVLSTTV